MIKETTFILVVVVMAGFYVDGLPVTTTSHHQENLHNQTEILKEMGCEPIYKKIAVIDLISPEDKLRDELLIPNVLGVLRCDDSCSYCGGDLGLEMKKCLPEERKSKTFSVSYYEGGHKKYFSLSAEEHLKCSCQSPRPSAPTVNEVPDSV